jgi:ChrR Cupin-like domain
VLFVKLWQFDLADRTSVRRDAQTVTYTHAQGRPGVETAALFQDSREDVRVERWLPSASVTLELRGGGEFLVLDGAFRESGEEFAPQSWLRLPPQGHLNAIAGSAGCALWVKTGHLSHILAPPGAST